MNHRVEPANSRFATGETSVQHSTNGSAFQLGIVRPAKDDCVIRYRCDGCQHDLQRDGSNHFIVRIEAFAAAGTLEFTEKDLQRDHRSEMETIIRDLACTSPDEIEDQVYRSFRYDLCPECHRVFLKNPLARVIEERRRS